MDVPGVARQTIESVGYTDATFGFDCKTCGVLNTIQGQSPDIDVLIVVLLVGAGLWVSGLLPHCCGARQAPSWAEEALARRLRSWSLPSGAAQRRNPLTGSPELLQESARHFADHCASCHGNDGSGNTEIGLNLYPPAPDMRLAATQQLSDGELYYIVHNGVRWTGMPAWGEPGMITIRTAGSWSCSCAIFPI